MNWVKKRVAPTLVFSLRILSWTVKVVSGLSMVDLGQTMETALELEDIVRIQEGGEKSLLQIANGDGNLLGTKGSIPIKLNNEGN